MTTGKMVDGICFEPYGRGWESLGRRLRVFMAEPCSEKFIAMVDGASIAGRNPNYACRFLTPEAAMRAAVALMRKLDKDAGSQPMETP